MIISVIVPMNTFRNTVHQSFGLMHLSQMLLLSLSFSSLPVQSLHTMHKRISGKQLLIT